MATALIPLPAIDAAVLSATSARVVGSTVSATWSATIGRQAAAPFHRMSATCAAAGERGGSSPLERALREAPVEIARYLSVRDLCNVGATGRSARSAIGDAVLPARLLGVRAATLRDATGSRFPSFLWHLAALARHHSFRELTSSSRLLRFDSRRHGPARCRKMKSGLQQPLIFGGRYLLSTQCSTGRTEVLHRMDVEALQIARDGVATRFELGARNAAPINILSVSPDGRICVALTGRVQPQLHKICMDDRGRWHVVAYPLSGLDIGLLSCIDVDDRGVVVMLGKREGERSTLYRWQQERGLQGVPVHLDGFQQIVAVAPGGNTLVMQSLRKPVGDTYLLNVETGAAGDPLQYAFRLLPRQYYGAYEGAIGDFVFSPDGVLLAMVAAECAAPAGFPMNAIFFIDVAAALERTPAGHTIDMHDAAIARLHQGAPIPGEHASTQLRFQADGRTLMQIPKLCYEQPDYVLETHFPWIAMGPAISRALGRAVGDSPPRPLDLSASHAAIRATGSGAQPEAQTEPQTEPQTEAQPEVQPYRLAVEKTTRYVGRLGIEPGRPIKPGTAGWLPGKRPLEKIVGLTQHLRVDGEIVSAIAVQVGAIQDIAQRAPLMRQLQLLREPVSAIERASRRLSLPPDVPLQMQRQTLLRPSQSVATLSSAFATASARGGMLPRRGAHAGQGATVRAMHAMNAAALQAMSIIDHGNAKIARVTASLDISARPRTPVVAPGAQAQRTIDSLKALQDEQAGASRRKHVDNTAAVMALGAVQMQGRNDTRRDRKHASSAARVTYRRDSHADRSHGNVSAGTISAGTSAAFVSAAQSMSMSGATSTSGASHSVPDAAPVHWPETPSEEPAERRASESSRPLADR